MIYNEIVSLREYIKESLDSHNQRISALEALKNKVMGMVVLIGCFAGYIFDLIKERLG